MKLIIDIPEDMYNDANILIVKNLPELKKAIANGKPLPKGHGRLIDADKFIENYEESAQFTMTLLPQYANEIKERTDEICTDIENAPTIIEADKEVRNDE